MTFCSVKPQPTDAELEEWRKRAILAMEQKMEENLSARTQQPQQVVNESIRKMNELLASIAYSNASNFSVKVVLPTFQVSLALKQTSKLLLQRKLRSYVGVHINACRYIPCDYASYWSIADNWWNRHKGSWFGDLYFLALLEEVYNHCSLISTLVNNNNKQQTYQSLIFLECLKSIAETTVSFNKARPQPIIFDQSLEKSEKLKQYFMRLAAKHQIPWQIPIPKHKKKASALVMRNSFLRWIKRMCNKMLRIFSSNSSNNKCLALYNSESQTMNNIFAINISSSESDTNINYNFSSKKCLSLNKAQKPKMKQRKVRSFLRRRTLSLEHKCDDGQQQQQKCIQKHKIPSFFPKESDKEISVSMEDRSFDNRIECVISDLLFKREELPPMINIKPKIPKLFNNDTKYTLNEFMSKNPITQPLPFAKLVPVIPQSQSSCANPLIGGALETNLQQIKIQQNYENQIKIQKTEIQNIINQSSIHHHHHYHAQQQTLDDYYWGSSNQYPSITNMANVQQQMNMNQMFQLPPMIQQPMNNYPSPDDYEVVFAFRDKRTKQFMGFLPNGGQQQNSTFAKEQSYGVSVSPTADLNQIIPQLQQLQQIQLRQQMQQQSNCTSDLFQTQHIFEANVVGSNSSVMEPIVNELPPIVDQPQTQIPPPISVSQQQPSEQYSQLTPNSNVISSVMDQEYMEDIWSRILNQRGSEEGNSRINSDFGNDVCYNFRRASEVSRMPIPPTFNYDGGSSSGGSNLASVSNDITIDNNMSIGGEADHGGIYLPSSSEAGELTPYLYNCTPCLSASAAPMNNFEDFDLGVS